MTATKVCCSCNSQKLLSNFGKAVKSKDGFNSHCLVCRRLKNTPLVFAMRQKQHAELSKYACCACGFEHKNAKEVHHLSQKYKRYGRSQDIRYNLEDIKMGYAIVLCPTCHVLFHAAHGGKNKPFPLYTIEQTIEIIMKERNPE